MTDFDYQQINDLLHSRIRLAVMAALLALETASFSLIKDRVGTTDGNLSVHIRKLEEAGYVSVKKSFVDRKPLSIYQLTETGKTALKTYINNLENLLNPSGN